MLLYVYYIGAMNARDGSVMTVTLERTERRIMENLQTSSISVENVNREKMMVCIFSFSQRLFMEVFMLRNVLNKHLFVIFATFKADRLHVVLGSHVIIYTCWTEDAVIS